jgi:hypothetical protein
MHWWIWLFVWVLPAASSAGAQFTHDDFIRADKAIVRLPPSAFPNLPSEVRTTLEIRGCMIPQTFISTKPHNVIQGEFKKKDQTDWAILCSKDSDSSILVFWAGSNKKVDVIKKSPDKNWLQSIGNDKIGFSRLISPVDQGFILEHYKRHGGSKPPPIRHQGIDESFVQKGSVVHYYYHGKWLDLTGAD